MADEPQRRNGTLSIPLPFDDALEAAMEVPPESIPPVPKRAKPAKPRKKKPAKNLGRGG